MSYFRLRTIFAATGVVCLLPAVAVAQQKQMRLREDLLKQAASAPTPRTADGHPDLSGLWDALRENDSGIPNQLSNAGIEVTANGTTDIQTGAVIATFPPDGKRMNGSDSERAATLLRRMGSNKPIYKPEYWARVQDFDANSNEDDPAYHCMAAGVPRIGAPADIAQSPTLLTFIYPGQGGLLATQTTYRVIPTDGRKHTPLDDLDGTWNGEGIGHWEGDTMVIDTIGFNSSTYLDQVGGYFHSENMHVIERLHRNGNTLTWQATIDDPDVLLRPWTTNKRVELLNPDPKAVLEESMPCSERDLAHAVTKEHH